MRGRARGVAHIVQAIEEGDEIEVPFRIVLGGADLEPAVGADTMLAGMSLSVLDRARVKIVAYKLQLGKACAIITVDTPWPQPTSATLAPFSSLATTPSSAGNQFATRLL